MNKRTLLLLTSTIILFVLSSIASSISATEKYKYGKDNCASPELDGCVELALGKQIGFPMQYGYISTDFISGNPHNLRYSNLSQLKPLPLAVDMLLCITIVYIPYKLIKILISRNKNNKEKS